MTYPGNNSLSSEIRRRVRETFVQTLDLAASGSQREALLGCDFILRLDPMFEPARELQKRIKAGGEGIAVDDLRATLGPQDDDAAAPAPAEEQIAPALADLGSIELDLSAPPEGSAVTQPIARPKVEAAGDFDPDADAPTMRIDTLKPPQPPVEPEADGELDPLADAPTMRIEPLRPPAVDRSTVQIDTAETDDDAFAGEPTMRLEPISPVETGPRPSQGSAASSLDTESELRVRELLQEGQTAFDSGEPQMAIDAWSRIFLIDIDHPEATERIERARKLKAEIERSLEQSLHEGISLAEAGEHERARELFEKVLQEEPGHAEAREQLEMLERRERGGDSPAATPAPVADSEREEARPQDETTARAAPAREAGKAGAPRMAPMEATKERPKPSRTFLIIGSAVLLLVLGAGWFVFTNWSRFFPNAAGGGNGGFDPIAHAEELYRSGQTAIAIGQLEKIPADDPSRPRADELIEQMKRGPAQAPTEFELDDELAERAEILSRARGALSAGDSVRAEALFAEAHELAALDGESAAAYERLRRRLDPVREQLEIFRQGEWEIALRELWPLHQARPDAEVVTDLMVDCYYNLGVRDLQRGDTGSAAEMFGEAAKLHPTDRQLERLTRFATTYSQRNQDLLYRIFVKYLPFR